MARVADRLRSALTLGAVSPAAFAAVRESRAELAGLARREAAAVRRLEEAAAGWDQLVTPWERWQDSGLGGPWGAAGTAADRRGGKDAPLFYTEQDLRQHRWLSRYLCDTNPFAIGFLGLLVDFHVRSGFGWTVCLRGARKGAADTGTAAVDPAVRACQAVLDEWRDGDPDHPRTSWPVRSREAFRRWRRDGEVFLRWFKGGADTRGLPAARFVDPARVGSPDGDTTTPKSFGVATDEVEFIDLVADPATTKGLFESKGNPVQTTIKLFVEAVAKLGNATSKHILRGKRLAEMDGMSDVPVAAAPADDADPNAAIDTAFGSAMHAQVDAFIAGKLDMPAMLAKLKDIAKAHGNGTDSAEPPAAKDDAAPATKESKRGADPWAVLAECRAEKYDPSPAQLETLALQTDAAKRKAFILESKQAAPAETVKTGGRTAATSKVATEAKDAPPTDGKGFGAWVQEERE